MFWSGDDWTYLHHMTIMSHLKVGHDINMWLHGGIPKSDNWCNYSHMTVKDADEIIDISHFMKNGGNLKTASSLFRWNLLYYKGGWYSDTDAVAINRWPDDKYIICGEYEDKLSTGVIKSPSGDPMFNELSNNVQKDWGNVNIFNDMCIKYRGDNKPTCNHKLFYPFDWRLWDIWLEPYTDVYDECSSIHLYHTMFERSGMIQCITDWMDRHPQSLLSTIDRMITR